MPGEFLWRERWPGLGNGRRRVRRGIHGQVHQDCPVAAAEDQPTERVAVIDPLDAPASRPDRFLQCVAGCGDVAELRRGEKVEVFGGPGGQVLCQ